MSRGFYWEVTMDKMKIEILPDGRVKTTTDEVSGPNHQSAEEFLKTVARLMGGEVVRTKRSGAHLHHHGHEEEHTHQ